LEAVRQTLATVTDHFAHFEAQALDAHVDFPLFQRLALPISSGNTKIPGIKIQDTRMLRLMEVLLHRGTQLGGWRSRQIHHAILSAFQLTPENYTLTQLRYDLRKLKAHALLQRDGHRDAQVRDKVDFDVLDEVAVQGVLVIPKGSVAWVRSPRLKPSAEWLWK